MRQIVGERLEPEDVTRNLCRARARIIRAGAAFPGRSVPFLLGFFTSSFGQHHSEEVPFLLPLDGIEFCYEWTPLFLPVYASVVVSVVVKSGDHPARAFEARRLGCDRVVSFAF